MKKKDLKCVNIYNQSWKDLIKIIGHQELKRVYDEITDRKIGNYLPEMLDLMKRITLKYASWNSK